MFVDEIKVYAKAGHGGPGAVAFHREAYRPKGGPSGGNGGHGGDVILEADHDLNNLINQFFQPRLIAELGKMGKGKGMDGKAGKDLIIKVPCGTLVWRIGKPPLAAGLTAVEPGTTPKSLEEDGTESEGVAEDETLEPDEESDEAAQVLSANADRPVIRSSGGVRALELDLAAGDGDDSTVDKGPAPEPERELVCDLTTNGQRFVLCKGGRGGLGNRNFATSVHQAPRYAQPGEPGEEGNFLFELRIIAEVGVVGYPNAGKSTLLAAISHARPKIAPYPFTTLTPQIGIVEYPDHMRLTVCDVPGLIAGAHENVGLGHAFLRHIARCTVLLILLDMAGTDGREPWDDYKSLIEELELYDPVLLDKPRYVIANKMDEPQAEVNLKAFKRKVRKVSVLPISAAFDEGIPTLKKLMREAVAEAKAGK